MSRLFPMQLPLRTKEDYQGARNLLATIWGSYSSEHPELVMTIAEPHIPNTDSQRKAVHAWFGEIASHTGHTAAEVKDFLMAELAGTETVTIKGKSHERRVSWTDLNKEQASDLMARVQVWAVQTLGVHLV